jgi:hypothetical protein
VRRLLIAHRAAEQHTIARVAFGWQAVRADPVLALVEHVEPVRIGRQDRARIEQRHSPVVPFAAGACRFVAA